MSPAPRVASVGSLLSGFFLTTVFFLVVFLVTFFFEAFLAIEEVPPVGMNGRREAGGRLVPSR